MIIGGYDMFMEFEGTPRIYNPEKSQIGTAIDSIKDSFIILENEKGDYIQAGGGGNRFTVEVRTYLDKYNFSHWKAEIKESDDTSKTEINISGANVQIQKNQVLDRKTVKILFESFMDGNYLPDIVNWDDITSMFVTE